jgi:Putative peptidoglycan binding domain/HEAT repeats
MSHRPLIVLATCITSYVTFFAPMVGLSSVPVARVEERAIAQSPSTSPSPTLLKLGSRGSQVTELQQQLRRLGYGVTLDGVFGDDTKFAVIDFQKKTGLPVDGQVGATTWQALRNAPTLTGEPSPLSPSDTTTDAADGANRVDRPRNSLGWLPFVVIGLGGATLLGGGLYWWQRRSRSIKKPTLRPTSALQVSSTHQIIERGSSHSGDHTGEIAAEPLHSERSEHEDANGTHLVLSAEPTKSDLSPVLSEVTRLTKVDIGEELIKDLNSIDPTKRRKAIWELGQRGDSKAIQPLVNLMMDADSNQRSLILAAISEIGVRTLKPMNRALIVSLQDESVDVRKNAIRDITRIYDLVAQLSHLLCHAAEDPDAEVQETARWALSQLSRIRALGDGEEK